LNQALSNYPKGMLASEEVIQELLKLAKDTETEKVMNDIGRNAEEKAFYDALTKPRAVRDFYTNDIFSRNDQGTNGYVSKKPND
jgi:type I restriction enzyme R subunit